MKYVCIRTYPRVWPSGWKANRPPPVKGEIFTKIGSYKRWEAWYFCFAELDVRGTQRRRIGFHSQHFRPITDISDLKKLTEVIPRDETQEVV
jgi:hypothetical protein